MKDLHYHSTPALDTFLSDLNRLVEAALLLEEIWYAMDPYNFPGARHPGIKASTEKKKEWEVHQELIIKMHRHFGYDDGE